MKERFAQLFDSLFSKKDNQAPQPVETTAKETRLSDGETEVDPLIQRARKNASKLKEDLEMSNFFQALAKGVEAKKVVEDFVALTERRDLKPRQARKILEMSANLEFLTNGKNIDQYYDNHVNDWIERAKEMIAGDWRFV